MPNPIDKMTELTAGQRNQLFKRIDEFLKAKGLPDDECRVFLDVPGRKGLSLSMYRKYRTSAKDFAPLDRLLSALDELDLSSYAVAGGDDFSLRPRAAAAQAHHPLSVNGFRGAEKHQRGIHYLIYYRSSRRAVVGDEGSWGRGELSDTRVNRAHLMLDPVKGNAYLAFYQTQNETAVDAPQRKLADRLEEARVLVLRGDYEWLRQEHVYIRLRENEVRTPKMDDRQVGDFSHAVHVNYPETEDTYRNRMDFVAVFSSWEPAAGLCYFQRINVAEAPEKLEVLFDGTSVPAYISRMLTGRSFSRPLEPDLFNPGIYRKLIRDLAPWCGFYEGFYMRSKGKKLQLRRLLVEVYDGYMIRYYSHDKNGSISHGFVADYDGNKLHCCLHRNPHLGHHLIHLCLTPNHQFDDERILVGIHGGHRGDGLGPDAGRAILFQLNAAPTAITGDTYLLGNKEQIDELLQRRPQLQSFFAGTMDDFLDNNVSLDSRILLRERFRYLGGTNDSVQPAGYFLSIRRSVRKALVYQSLIRVDQYGRATRNIVYEDQIEQRRLEGELISKPGSLLNLNFYREYYRPSAEGSWSDASISRTSLIPDASRWAAVPQGKPITDQHMRVGHTVRAGLAGAVSSFKEYFIFYGDQLPDALRDAADREYRSSNEVSEVMDPFITQLIKHLLNLPVGIFKNTTSTLRSVDNFRFEP